jgi:hypothetical protein
MKRTDKKHGSVTIDVPATKAFLLSSWTPGGGKQMGQMFPLFPALSRISAFSESLITAMSLSKVF